MDFEETKETPQIATQETIKKLVNNVSLIAEKGDMKTSFWKDNAGVLDTYRFHGYSAFVVNLVTAEARKSDPEHKRSTFPIASIKLFRPSDIGEKIFEYEIKKRDGNLSIDKHETLKTESDEQKYKERTKKLKEGDKKTMLEIRDEVYENMRLKAQEKATGLSFVGENEAAFLNDLLEDIYKKAL